ncbi:MAG TPA: MFS transporter, partial [Alphaproteobacteria bacterium]|nr:MFS transporter [Alphaproteobacteria bacterium]
MLSNRRLALFVLAFGFAAAALVRGTQETYAVFLLPISAEFGWQRAEVSSVYSVAFLTLGLSGPLVGSLFDRFGPLGVYLPGAACAGAGCLLASQAQTLWQFYIVLGLLFGFAVASCGYVPMAALLSRWFRRRLNTALAFGHSSHGIGILLLAPTAQRLIDAWGWRHAYLGLAGIVLLLLPPALLLPWRRVTAGHPDYRMASPPPRHASAPVRDGAVPGATAALRMPAFWGIAATFFFTSVGMYAINLQTPAYLVEIGYTPQQAARAYGLIGLLLPAGMIGFGWLGDRLGRRRAVLISYAGTL